jgi:hypothetical protein
MKNGGGISTMPPRSLVQRIAADQRVAVAAGADETPERTIGSSTGRDTAMSRRLSGIERIPRAALRVIMAISSWLIAHTVRWSTVTIQRIR